MFPHFWDLLYIYKIVEIKIRFLKKKQSSIAYKDIRYIYINCKINYI